jgi:hypothetical protein
MLPSSEQLISEKDRQVIEEYHLGSPLAFFRSASLYPLLFLGASFVLLFLGIIILVFIFATILVRRSQLLPNDYALFALRMSMAGTCFLAIWYILRIEKPKFPKKKNLIVCEQGCLQETTERGHERLDIVRWSDILAIKYPAPQEMAYTFVLRDGEPFLLDRTYQNVETLVELIKERIESASHHNRDGDKRMEEENSSSQ